MAEQAGSIDISRNTLSNDAVQRTPLIERSVDDFSQPVAKAMRAQFLTAGLSHGAWCSGNQALF